MRLRMVTPAVICAVMLLAPGVAKARNGPCPMVNKINAVRAKHGLAPLHYSKRLANSARGFAHRLMATDRFSHMGIHPSSQFNRVGEALAFHQGWRPQLGGTVRGWLNSPGHRALVLGGSFGFVGAGSSHGRFGGSPATIWVLQFGAR
jgi:uncharacterized protein YkwD